VADDRFARDTALRPLGAGGFEARIDRGWWIVRGPNGGYVAAIVLRAMAEAVGDPARHPRSLTVHYVAPLEEGAARLETRVERRGRSLATCTARVHQDGRLRALGVGAFSPPWPGPTLHDRVAPEAPPPEACPPGPSGAAPAGLEVPPMIERYEMRWALGHPPGEAPREEAVAGGWIRMREPHVVDAPALAAISDAWVPPIFSRTREPLVVPTVDLTVHFRATTPLAGAAADDWVLAVFRTTTLQEGFLEEDGEVWSADGCLLAQSRQLAVAMPRPDA